MKTVPQRVKDMVGVVKITGISKVPGAKKRHKENEISNEKTG